MNEDPAAEQILKAAIDLLMMEGEEFAPALLLNCNIKWDNIDSWYDQQIERQVNAVSITLSGPAGVYKVLRGLAGLSGTTYQKVESHEEWAAEEAARSQSSKAIRAALDTAVDSVLPDSTLGAVWIRLQSSPPYPGWREEYVSEIRGDKVPSNQAVVASHPPSFAWNGLRFRSKTEIVMAQAFSRKGVLYFPLAAAVSGQRKLEPDFLICTDQGKWGILEVHGDDWHPPETAAKEHERGRWFKALGVRFYEVYGASECYNDASGVVERFLKLLAAS